MTIKAAKSRKMMVNIDVDLYEALRAASYETHKSMSKIVSDAVRRSLAKRKGKANGEETAATE